MHGPVYRNRAQTLSTMTALKRIERLQRLYDDLASRFGAEHSLTRRVADQLARTRVVLRGGEEVA